MHSGRRDGRLLGSLLLLQLAGLIVPFVMLGPVATPGYLAAAAGSAGQIRFAVLLLLANGALTTAIAITQYPRFRITSLGLARWLVVLGSGMIVLQAVDNTQVMGMLALSQAYGAADAQGPGLVFEVLGPATAATRRAAHYSVLLVIEAWMLVFYLACWRTRAVPWILPAVGVLAAALHVIGATMPVFLGTPAMAPLTMVLAASHVALALWLMTRGFEVRPPGGAPAHPGEGATRAPTD